MDIFEQASRQKLRYPSAKGELTTEQLWDLPLTHKTGFDLDNVAKAVNRDLIASSEDSFVVSTANPAKAANELKLDVLKFIIASKQAEALRLRNAGADAAERQRLLEVLHAKENDALRELTPEQIKARLAQLGG